MARRSIGSLHAQVTADAKQFVAEFNRADNVSRRSAASIDREVTKLTRSVRRKFEIGDIGKDLMRGLGIGGGLAVAQTAAEQIAGFWERAADAAKEVAGHSEAQLKAVKELIDLRRSDQQKLDAAIKEEARLRRELENARAPRTTVSREMVGRGQYRNRTIGRPHTDEELKAIQRLDEELKQQAVEVEKLRQAVEKEGAAASKKNAQDREQAAQKELRALEQRTAEQQRINEAYETTAEKFRDLIDPNRELAQQLEQIDDLFWAGHLSAEEAAASIAEVTKAAEELKATNIEKALERVFGDLDEKSMKAFKEEAKELQSHARDLGYAFESAFETAILEGEKFSDVLKGLGRDLAQIAIREAITQPLGSWFAGMLGGKKSNGIGGLIGGFLGMFGGFRAGGGPVSSGVPYVVGERGPEMFVPRTAGAIVPNNRMPGGNTYMIDARGADAGAVARIEAALIALAGPGVVERRAIGAMNDRRLRGPAFV